MCYRFLGMAALREFRAQSEAPWRFAMALTVVALWGHSTIALAAAESRIVLYHAFAQDTRLVLKGRLLEGRMPLRSSAEDSGLSNTLQTLQAMESDEIVGAVIDIWVGGHGYRLTTDDDGVFSAVLGLPAPLSAGAQMALRYRGQRGERLGASLRVPVLILGKRGTLLITDFDDTLMESGVTQKLRLFKNAITKNAAQLRPVPGAGDLLSTAQGLSMSGPFLVSGSPQNFHDKISEFFVFNHLPTPQMFLKNFSAHSLFAQHGHKLRALSRILSHSQGYGVVLVGDSGEADPEIYRELQKRFPGRIQKIIIRSVREEDSQDAARFSGMLLVKDYNSQWQRVFEALKGAAPKG